jgi:serine/threonine-protein kinase
MTPIAHARFQAAVADRYVIDDVLGSGSAGTVYLARDVKHGRQVAIKVLQPSALQPSAVQDSGPNGFLREIRLTARLQHPHILPLLDSGEAGGCAYYVMPFVKGGSLRELLTRRMRLSAAEALDVVRDLAGALDYAHENRVIHCDVKPENVLLSGGHAIIADFGVSRALHGDRNAWRAALDTSVGTPDYVSPEQASGEPHLGAETDLYSLACMVYEMLAGVAPFAGASDMAVVASRFTRPAPDIRTVARHVPNRVAGVLRRAMALEPGRRYRSVAAFLRAFERAVETRKGWVREAIGLGTTRMFSRLRRTTRLSLREPRAARRLIERSRESLETIRLSNPENRMSDVV